VTGIHCGEDSGLGGAWEANLRMPGVVRWPGKVKAGAESWDSVSTLDVMPTVLKLAGMENLPKDLDGMDVSELWFNDPEDCISSDAFKTQKEQVDGRFDVVAAKRGPIKAWIYTKSGMSSNSDVEVYHDPPLLFDVVADPAESTPLDPALYKDVSEKIMNAVKKHKESVTRVGPLTLAEGDELFPCVDKKKDCRTC
jgi:arylsulfatase A-like enzyme